MPIIEHCIDSPRGPMRWLETSGEGLAIALLHGNSSSVDHWRPLMEGPLGARHRVCALELPGHGRSNNREPSAYTLAAVRRYVGHWVEVAHLYGAVCVGHSLGGHVWLQQGAARLNLHSGLFVFGTPPLRSAADAARAFHPHPAMAAFGKCTLCDDELQACAEAATTPSVVGRGAVLAALRDTDGRFRERFIGSLAGELHDEIAVLDAMRRPVAIVHGDEDPLVSRDYLARLRPPTLWRGSVQVLEGAGHYPQLSMPERLVGLLSAFIAESVSAT